MRDTPASRRYVAAGAGVFCSHCRHLAPSATRPLSPRDAGFLHRALQVAPGALEAGHEVRRGGGLEALLRGAIESFLERPVRGYRHLRLLEEPRP